MLTAFATGVCLWLAYGLILAKVPIIVFNGITLVLIGVLLALKLRFRARPLPIAP